MKTGNRTMYQFLALLALVTLALWGCKDELNKTGYDLLLPGDLISAHKVSISKASIKAYTVKDEKLRTSKPAYNLLGTFVDPVFGKTTADFACQFRLSETPKFALGDRIDSMVLYLSYWSFYGDTVTIQNYKAYELKTDLDADDTTKYYQDIDLQSMAKSAIVGELEHRTIHRDSLHSTASKARDTITIVMRIKLDKALGQKLMVLSDSALKVNPGDPNIPFLQYFKGLYIKAGDLNQGGAIMRVVPHYITLYTHSATTTSDSAITYFDVTKNSARVNRFAHNYTNTAFAANLDKQNQQDSLIYLQTTGGLSNKIYIPELSNWKDSANVSVNKAELILKVEPTFIDTVTFIPPSKLILSLIDDQGKIYTSAGKLIYPADLKFSESYYGGTYHAADSTYRFNLAGHMQQLIKGIVKNNGFYLTTDNKNSVFNRVVLKGATSKTGIRFDITYSKFK